MNKELHYFGIFNSHNYFPKPNKYVMEINSNDKIVKSTLEAIVIHFTNSIDSLNYNDLNNFLSPTGASLLQQSFWISFYTGSNGQSNHLWTFNLVTT